jgi:hypothetical protein
MRYPKEIEYVKAYLNQNFVKFSPVSNFHSYAINGNYEFEIMEHLQYDIVDCSEHYNLVYIFKDKSSAEHRYTTINTKYNFAGLEEMLDLFNKINKLWECVKKAESPLLQEKEFNKMLKIINIDSDFC